MPAATEVFEENLSDEDKGKSGGGGHLKEKEVEKNEAEKGGEERMVIIENNKDIGSEKKEAVEEKEEYEEKEKEGGKEGADEEEKLSNKDINKDLSHSSEHKIPKPVPLALSPTSPLAALHNQLKNILKSERDSQYSSSVSEQRHLQAKSGITAQNLPMIIPDGDEQEDEEGETGRIRGFLGEGGKEREEGKELIVHDPGDDKSKDKTVHAESDGRDSKTAKAKTPSALDTHKEPEEGEEGDDEEGESGGDEERAELMGFLADKKVGRVLPEIPTPTHKPFVSSVAFVPAEEKSMTNFGDQDIPTNVYMDENATKAAPFTLASQWVVSFGSSEEESEGGREKWEVVQSPLPENRIKTLLTSPEKPVLPKFVYDGAINVEGERKEGEEEEEEKKEEEEGKISEEKLEAVDGGGVAQHTQDTHETVFVTAPQYSNQDKSDEDPLLEKPIDKRDVEDERNVLNESRNEEENEGRNERKDSKNEEENEGSNVRNDSKNEEEEAEKNNAQIIGSPENPQPQEVSYHSRTPELFSDENPEEDDQVLPPAGSEKDHKDDVPAIAPLTIKDKAEEHADVINEENIVQSEHTKDVNADQQGAPPCIPNGQPANSPRTRSSASLSKIPVRKGSSMSGKEPICRDLSRERSSCDSPRRFKKSERSISDVSSRSSSLKYDTSTSAKAEFLRARTVSPDLPHGATTNAACVSGGHSRIPCSVLPESNASASHAQHRLRGERCYSPRHSHGCLPSRAHVRSGGLEGGVASADGGGGGGASMIPRPPPGQAPRNAVTAAR